MTADNDTLGTDPVLDRLPSALVNGLNLSNYRASNIDRGRSIISDGQPVTAIYLISEGWAVSKMSLGTGDSQILDILGPGSFAGMSRFDASRLDDYSAIALQNLKAYRIEIDTIQSLCAQNEQLSLWLTNTLSRQTQRAQRHLAALGQLPARGRLAFVMLRILDVAQQTGHSAIDEVIRLPMTQEEIGNMLGLTNVSISKLMSSFRKEGLIDYGRNRIIIHDIASLSDICGMQMEEIATLNPFTDYGTAPVSIWGGQSA